MFNLQKAWRSACAPHKKRPTTTGREMSQLQHGASPGSGHLLVSKSIALIETQTVKVSMCACVSLSRSRVPLTQVSVGEMLLASCGLFQVHDSTGAATERRLALSSSSFSSSSEQPATHRLTRQQHLHFTEETAKVSRCSSFVWEQHAKAGVAGTQVKKAPAGGSHLCVPVC